MSKFRKHQPPAPVREQAQEAPDFVQPTPTRRELPESVSKDGRAILGDYKGLYASLPDDPAKTAHMREFAARFCQAAKLDPNVHLQTIIDYLTT
jgi:hypothetical protein